MTRAMKYRTHAQFVRSVCQVLLFLILLGFISVGGTAPQSSLAAPSYVPLADVTLNIPANALIGQNFTFTVTFDNTGADTGYGPFIDLILPRNGADGAAGTDTPDGIDFASASYLGQLLRWRVITIPAGGCVAHPFARDTNNVAVPVCGTPGDRLVVLELPFGSFTPGQPAAEIEVTGILSPLADPNLPLTIRARGGYRFGQNPLDDPCCDPVILSPGSSDSSVWPGQPVEPILLRLEKGSNAPEDGDETASGPNFRHRYTITVDIPDGQTVTDLDVVDDIPSNIAYAGLVSSTPPLSGLIEPPLGVATPGAQLIVNYASVTGGPQEDDITIVIEYFVPQVDANGNPVLNPNMGTSVVAENQARAVGDWTPPDPRDAASADNATTPGGTAPEHILAIRSLATQKGRLLANDTGDTGITPGDTIEYSISFQVSDFFTFGDLLIEDIFSDGQRLDTTFAPTYTITDRAGTFNGTFVAGSTLTVDLSEIGNDTDPATDGSTRLVFNVSQALINAGDDGILQGGRTVPPDSVGARGTIRYRTVIQDAYSDTYASGDPSVDLGDMLSNDATATGTIRDPNDNSIVLNPQDDVAEVETQIKRGTLAKSIYAINGTICQPQPCNAVELAVNDTVTYRLLYSLPASDYDRLRLIDYLPLPIFNAAEVSTFSPVVNGNAPAAGVAKFGATDTFFAVSGVVPSLGVDAVQNTLIFDYGSFDSPTNPTSQIDVLFTVTVGTRPFADDLLLTNQVRAVEGSTNLETGTSDSIAQMEVGQPYLVVRKSVVGTDSTQATLIPPSPGGIGWLPPGTPGDSWTGFIDSNGLATNPIDSDLSGAVPGDLIRFAIIVENLGTNRNGAFDIRIRDTLPPGFRLPPNVAAMNLTIRRGDGTVIGFIPLGRFQDARDLFDVGIELVDPSPVEGVCQRFDDNNGRNIIVITFDLAVDNIGPESGLIRNTAQVTQYGSADGFGRLNNYVRDAQLYRDSAEVQASGFTAFVSGGQGGAADIVLSKTGTLTPDSLGLPGEEVTWLLTIANFTGSAVRDVVVTDTLIPELRIVAATVSKGTVTFSGRNLTFNIPELFAGETVTAQVTSTIVSAPPDGVLPNTANLTAIDANGQTLARTATAEIDVITGLPNTGYPPSGADTSRTLHWFEDLLLLGLLLIGVRCFQHLVLHR